MIPKVFHSIKFINLNKSDILSTSWRRNYRVVKKSGLVHCTSPEGLRFWDFPSQFLVDQLLEVRKRLCAHNGETVDEEGRRRLHTEIR